MYSFGLDSYPTGVAVKVGHCFSIRLSVCAGSSGRNRLLKSWRQNSSSCTMWKVCWRMYRQDWMESWGFSLMQHRDWITTG